MFLKSLPPSIRLFDKSLLLATFFFMGLGLVQVYSSSYIFAIESYGDGLYFFKRQLIFSFIGILGLFVTLYIPWKYWERWGFLLFIAAFVGLLLTFVPSLGVKVGGAQRWLQLPFGFRFEPAELLKISYPLILGLFLPYLDDSEKRVSRTTWLLHMLLLLTPLALLIEQPDFGGFVICSLVIFSVFFAFGLSWKYIIPSLFILIGGGVALVVSSTYRMDRMTAYIDPWSDPEQDGFQIIQSLLSFQSGGVLGTGLGQGQGKLFFLPEAHTDFTLAVLGEELGFVGVAFVILLYGYIVFRGLQISVRSEKNFDKLVALGVTMVLFLSVFINVGMTLGLLPTKGLSLPFLSYGGSSLVCTCLGIGLLLVVDRHRLIQHKSQKFSGYQLGTP